MLIAVHLRFILSCFASCRTCLHGTQRRYRPPSHARSSCVRWLPLPSWPAKACPGGGWGRAIHDFLLPSAQSRTAGAAAFAGPRFARHDGLEAPSPHSTQSVAAPHTLSASIVVPNGMPWRCRYRRRYSAASASVRPAVTLATRAWRSQLAAARIPIPASSCFRAATTSASSTSHAPGYCWRNSRTVGTRDYRCDPASSASPPPSAA